jgi:hypothetical protein
MGLILSLFSSAKREVTEQLDGTQKAKIRAYKAVVDRMQEKETEKRVATQTNCCWLTIFYLQTIFAVCELPFRIILHFLLSKLYGFLACLVVVDGVLYFNWWRQEMLFQIYTWIITDFIIGFCCSPCDPAMYPFGQDYRLNRPPNPEYANRAKDAIMKKTLGTRNGCCCSCSSNELFTSVVGTCHTGVAFVAVRPATQGTTEWHLLVVSSRCQMH